MSVSVGIDLGTTFSAVAYIDPKTKLPQIIPNGEGSKLTPSVIQFLDGEVIFGGEAEDAYNAGEEDCVATFKREMGETKPYCYIGGKPYTSEDLSAMLLRHLKEEAEATLGDTIKEAVITVPAYFYSKEREATIRAAEKAGLKVKKIIDEPNAAAMAYGLNHWRENANILVYDLGGGTFDVTLVHMGKNGELSTITTRGNHKLGGRDWDARIEDILVARFENETDLSIRNDSELWSIVSGMSEGVKKQLSAQNMQSVKVSATFPDYGKATVTITKAEFEENTADLLDRTGALCLAVLEEAGLTKKDVTDVLLVGGSTRMPQVPEYLQRMFNKKPLSHVNPDEAVALGAAIQSSKANEDYTSLVLKVVDGKKTTDRANFGLSSHVSVKAERKLNSLSMLTLRETTAHAMGIIAISQDGKRYFNDILIPANHPRPVKIAKSYYVRTKKDESTKMEVFVVQGESENPLDNQIPFRYVVSGIRYVPRQRNQTRIRVQYSYDQNGVIHVEARQEDDVVNLPIQREEVPEDMSRFSRPVEEGDRSSSSMRNASSLSVYSKWAGISNIPTTRRDQFGNPDGEEFDLAPDGSFEGYGILILDLCHDSYTLHKMTNALKQKGFEVDIREQVPSAGELKSALKTMCQCWVISDSWLHLTEDHYSVLKKFFEKGNGLYIWGDNTPYIEDANFITTRLFGASLSGNYYGTQILAIQEREGAPGIIADHLISTGLVSFDEGITISNVKLAGGLEPLIFSSDSKIVTAFYEKDGKRALVDGGFTRLFDERIDNAGTARYVVNAAAWLANAERFMPDNGNNEDDTSTVPTW